MPPEFSDPKLTGKNADKIDVWSFGILIWELLKKSDKNLPFELNANPIQQTSSLPLPEDFQGFNVSKLKSTLSESKVHTLDPTGHLTSIMEYCLQPIHKRPSMLEIKELMEVIQSPIEASNS